MKEKLICEITNLLQSGRSTIAEATLKRNDGTVLEVATANAICNTDDKLDLKQGREIAINRAKAKAYANYRLLVAKALDSIQDLLDSLQENCEMLDERVAEFSNRTFDAEHINDKEPDVIPVKKPEDNK
jgi:adenosyl cobinamide kinase/adenosyl cobinamide phosphate guanylyltransferase